jgi:hypothetical protein
MSVAASGDFDVQVGLAQYSQPPIEASGVHVDNFTVDVR